MLRRLAVSLCSLSLLSSAAIAQQFAQAPSAGAPMPPHEARQPDGDVTRFEPEAPHAPSRALVLRALARRRAQNLARFHAYRTRGLYPHDLVASTTQNIWRDGEGHLCAAATMIDQDGQHDLVAKIADEQTY